MMLRRALFLQASLTVALRHTHHCTAARATTSATRSSSSTTTLWCNCAAAAEEAPLATVEDMFGRSEGADGDDDEGGVGVQHGGGASLKSSRHTMEEAFFEWVGDDSNSAAEGMGDFSLEGVINAALVGPHTQHECSAADRAHGSGTISNSSDGGLGVNCDDAGEGEERLVSHTNDRLAGDVDGYDGLVADGSGVLLGAVGGHDEEKDREGDVEEDDASSIAAAEEEEHQVEELLRATRTAEATAALFFKSKQRVIKRKAAKPSFDDAAAEGAELETVGEAMPSPQRF
ncbi:uncharacterized protein Tco025E_02354 [Trypanosoma conorhini]|uniref:Uncharacterized protein n=1 Tax=Trypanosoma conorhini TaxID=83891 RepID=A0A3S5IUD4_9TRYP|nr:uncharacterized protein Tco025E_02354 [Trypanosoma conorhini]RNF25331.1 hypothetical protein Tco025E_02354 [Trypanosoma conorhini]